MYGAIIGDIAGSIYEFDNIKTKNFPLFQTACFPTDDTYMTLAVGLACVECVEAFDSGFLDLRILRESLVREMHRLGRLYPDKGYGGRFNQWLREGRKAPYGSCGNGSAMRVSPCGWVCDTLADTLAMATASADVTHNSREGVKGARAVAAAIYLARTGHSKADIHVYIADTFGYDLSRTCAQIRALDDYWGALCQDTVPEAIIAFLESTDFEDAVRNAVSLGGDSDTLAAITGSIAEAYYGVPPELKKAADDFLKRDMRRQEHNAIRDFCAKYITREEEPK
jgi:ADP-ribosylglycohydrolase